MRMSPLAAAGGSSVVLGSHCPVDEYHELLLTHAEVHGKSVGSTWEVLANSVKPDSQLLGNS